MKKLIATLTLFCVFLLKTELVLAQTNPNPSVTIESYDGNISLGQSARIRVSAVNRGGRSDEGGITISFPQFTDRDDKSRIKVISQDSGRSPIIKGKGDNIYDGLGQPIPEQRKYVLVEIVDTDWRTNESHSLEIEVTPKSTGTFEFYARSAMKIPGSPLYINDPRRGDSRAYSSPDQQGWSVIRRVINVARPPEQKGSLRVQVRHPENNNLISESDLNALQLYRNDVFQEPEIKHSPGEYTFRDLSPGYTYRVDAYGTDMFLGSFTKAISSGENASGTITAPYQGTLRVRVFYADGTTPLQNAYVEVRSHENRAWRSGISGSDGWVSWDKSDRAYLFPNRKSNEQWNVHTFYNNTTIASPSATTLT